VPVHLEPAAQALSDATSRPPYLVDLGVEEGREALRALQSGRAERPDAEVGELVVSDGAGGSVLVRIVIPRRASATLPVILYIHGAGWVFGDSDTHDRLARQLAVGSGAAVIVPSYSRAPEARYPTAIEECSAVVRWIAEQGVEHGLDPGRVAIAGDDAGGNIAIALCLLSAGSGICFVQQVLFCPVTDARFDTSSYREFATGFFLRRDAMQWFWEQYTTGPSQRVQVTASPLRATLTDLARLPPTLLITAEADVLRDEGEAFADKLRQAGVAVTAARFQGTIHDFVVLDALAGTDAARGALALATQTLRRSFSVADRP
jgi:acetyl esterase/lipase